MQEKGNPACALFRKCKFFCKNRFHVVQFENSRVIHPFLDSTFGVHSVECPGTPTGTEKRTKKPSKCPLIFWWNPPFNLKVETKIGKRFLEIVDECCKKGTFWYKHFNCHTVKLSYLCNSGLTTKIAEHNANIINRTKQSKKAGCNCHEKNKADCPIPGNCKAKNVI